MTGTRNFFCVASGALLFTGTYKLTLTITFELRVLKDNVLSKCITDSNYVFHNSEILIIFQIRKERKNLPYKSLFAMTAHTELGSSQINHNHIVTFRNDTPTQLLHIVKKQFQPK